MPLLRSVLIAISFLVCATSAWAHEARLELGVVKTVSNRFSIPNPGGGRVSVKSDGVDFYGRGQLSWQISQNGFLRLLLAPLSANYEYRNAAVTVFNGTSFPAATDLRVKYRFNSYRLGYVHRFQITDSLKLQAGAVGKIRDARITVATGGLSSTYKNVGFVPLLNVGLLWKMHSLWELRFDLDGAAATQGRAFDGMLEVFRSLSDSGSGVSAGVRILEGGADNVKVNTFALLD